MELVKGMNTPDVAEILVRDILDYLKDRFKYLKSGIKYSLDYMLEEAFNCSNTLDKAPSVKIVIKKLIGILYQIKT